MKGDGVLFPLNAYIATDISGKADKMTDEETLQMLYDTGFILESPTVARLMIGGVEVEAIITDELGSILTI